MGQKINARSLRYGLWHRDHWAYYTSAQTAAVAWTQCLQNVLVWHTSLCNWKRFRALKAPSRRQRKKTALGYLNHWLRLLPYSQWYHNYSYKWGTHRWQRQLNPIKMRYRPRKWKYLGRALVRHRCQSSYDRYCLVFGKDGRAV